MDVKTYLDAVPVLAGEGVLGLLLEALLALRQSLVPEGNFGLASVGRKGIARREILVRLEGFQWSKSNDRNERPTFQQPS